MKLLSRSEEIALMAIWKLKDGAYGVPIRELVSQWTGHEWSFGAIYKPLKQLLIRDYVSKHISAPTTERGGRSKYLYEITPKGEKALKEMKKVQDNIWNDESKMAFD